MDKVYICGVCGKRYSTVAERNKCEQKCIVASEQAAEEKRKAELKKQQEAREKQVQEAMNKAADLFEKYYADYGTIPTVKIDTKLTSSRACRPGLSREYYDILKAIEDLL